MHIAILGNGPSVNTVNWDKELKDKDIIVRIHYGGFKNIYNEKYFNKEHHLILSGYFKNSETLDLSYDEQCYLKKYTKIKFVYGSKKIDILKLMHRFGKDSLYHLFNKQFMLFVEDALDQYSKKFNFKNTILQDKSFSTGIMTILYYIFYYPCSKIFLYGFNLDPKSGHFWDKDHKHSNNHDFEKEKLFLNTFSDKYEFRS
jgi:hypothetical protein